MLRKFIISQTAPLVNSMTLHLFSCSWFKFLLQREKKSTEQYVVYLTALHIVLQTISVLILYIPVTIHGKEKNKK